MKKKHVHKIGDRVRIVNPRWIKRVGYPLCWQDLLDSVETDPAVAAALTSIGVCSDDQGVLREIAKAKCAAQGFGGRVRSIHYEPLGSATPGQLFTGMPSHGYVGFGLWVGGKRTVKTGTYFPPSGGHGGFWAEHDDYEPGGLDDMKTHVLLHVGCGEIEECDVEPWGSNHKTRQSVATTACSLESLL